jgi:hypothetical protein
MEFGLSGVRVEFYNIRMGWSMGFVVGKTILLFVLLQAEIKRYMRELDMWSSVGELNGTHVNSISSSTTCVQLSHGSTRWHHQA